MLDEKYFFADALLKIEAWPKTVTRQKKKTKKDPETLSMPQLLFFVAGLHKEA